MTAVAQFIKAKKHSTIFENEMKINESYCETKKNLKKKKH
jgi:hypothetical protein